MSAVRPEFGPTLPELLAPRLRALPRAARSALAVLAAVVVLVGLWALLLRGGDDGTHGVVVRKPIALNFIYRAPFTREALTAGELAHVGGRGQSFAVRELRLPAYRGDSAGFLPVYATRLENEMARVLPGFQWRYEGRANVNKIQGYEIVFQYRRAGGRLAYGRRILLLPDTTARQGADLLLTAPRSPAIPRADAIGRNGPLKTSLRSFRFGTERP
jgi:hypothetical protein